MELKGNYEVAIVNFIQGTNKTKEYAFALYDGNFDCGDMVLCDTAYGYNVAVIVKIVSKEDYDKIKSIDVTKEIICKLDFKNFNYRKEIREKKTLLKRKMDQLLKENQDMLLYKTIAENNNEMATVLKEYESLGNY